MEKYKRRVGLEWSSKDYQTMIVFMAQNDVKVDQEKKLILSISDIEKLSHNIFPKHGHRKHYINQVQYFIDCYSERIVNDLLEFNFNNLEVLIAPKLKDWLYYKEELCSCMMQLALKETCNYMHNSNNTIPLNCKKRILNKLYNLSDNQEIQTWMIKKLNNALSFNRIEICDNLKGLFNQAKQSTFIEDEPVDFKGFTEQDRMQILSINNKYLEWAKSTLCQIKNKQSDSERNEIFCGNESITPEIRENICKKLLESKETTDAVLQPSRKINYSIEYIAPENHIIMKDMIQFDCVKYDTNLSVSLLKKLIILSISNKNRRDMSIYLNTIRVPDQTKKNILQTIYADSVKAEHYVHLEILQKYRYLIREKSKEIYSFFRKHNVDLFNTFHQSCSFEDAENIFYEVYRDLHRMILRTKDNCTLLPSNAIEIEDFCNLSSNLQFSKNENTESDLDNYNFAERLSIADDISTYIVIDLHCLPFMSHKTNKKIWQPLTKNKDFENIVKTEIKKFLDKEKTLIETTTTLLHSVKKIIRTSEKLSCLLKNQLMMYLRLLESDSGFKIQACYKYSKENYHGGKVCSTKFWTKNSIFHCLNGVTANLCEEQVNFLTKNNLNFSITYSTKSKKSQLWLGPGSYVNHNCKPNCRMYYLKEKNQLCLQAIQDIEEGEEISWFYSETYFENGSCECYTCDSKIKEKSQKQ